MQRGLRRARVWRSGVQRCAVRCGVCNAVRCAAAPPGLAWCGVARLHGVAWCGVRGAVCAVRFGVVINTAQCNVAMRFLCCIQ